MRLTIILPPIPRACDRNHGKNGIAAAGENKRARLIGKMKAVEAMVKQGVKRGELIPRRLWLYRFEQGRSVKDWDNIAAGFKRYQDGIFDALGWGDDCIMDAHVHKEYVEDIPGFSSKQGSVMAGWLAVVMENGPFPVFDGGLCEVVDLARAVYEAATKKGGRV